MHIYCSHLKERLIVETIFDFIIGAWILSWFSLDKLIIKGLRELFDIEATMGSYYLIFFALGILFAITKTLKSIDMV